MLMKDPRRYGGWEPYSLPGSKWPYALLVVGIFLVVALVASLATLTSPESHCDRPVAYQVPVTQFRDLCPVYGLHRGR